MAERIPPKGGSGTAPPVGRRKSGCKTITVRVVARRDCPHCAGSGRVTRTLTTKRLREDRLLTYVRSMHTAEVVSADDGEVVVEVP
jgi:hypothetical protein